MHQNQRDDGQPDDGQPDQPDDGRPGRAAPSAPRLPATRRHGVLGYTAGVFDMFHMGHLRLLREARQRCDYLIVGVTTDELALEVKGAAPVVPFLERIAIVQSMRYVDHVVAQLSMDKAFAWQTFGYDVLFVGDNNRGTAQWDATEHDVSTLGVQVQYLSATHERSGQLLERGLQDLVAE